MNAETAPHLLVAGIGNVFFSDDGFGVEVVHRLDVASLPETVTVTDYGIRGVHLAYDLLEGRYDTFIAVDALPMNEPAGTLAVLDVTGTKAADEPLDVAEVDAHTMDPYAVLRVLKTLGGEIDRVFIVGCQPGTVAAGMGLSPPVRAAVHDALRIVDDLVRQEACRRSVEATAIGASSRGEADA